MGQIIKKENIMKDEIVEIQCASCANITNHIVQVSLDKFYEDDEFSGNVSFQIVECGGCEVVSFRQASQSSDQYDLKDDGNPEFYVDEDIYPYRDKNSIPIKKFRRLPKSIRDIYEETITCFNNGCHILCGAGLRAVIEYLCDENGVNKGSLKDKIIQVQKKGILTKKHSDTLHELRLMGNDAVHNKVKPQIEELKNALDIIEHTLENIYNLPIKAEELSNTRSMRKN